MVLYASILRRRELIFTVPQLLAYISSFLTLDGPAM